jgi:hypothetical protein
MLTYRQLLILSYISSIEGGIHASFLMQALHISEKNIKKRNQRN